MNRLLTAAIAALLLLGQFKAKAEGTAATASKDTVLLKMKNGEKLMIITKKNQHGVSSLKEYDLNQVVRKVDSVLRNTTSLVVTEGAPGSYTYKDTSITIMTSPMRDKPADQSFRIDIRRDSARNLTINFTDRNGSTDSALVIKNSKNKKKKSDNDKDGLYINLGLTNWISRADGKFPDAQGLPQGLRTSGSRYFAIGAVHSIPFGKSSPVALNLGLELAWYNFMFSEDRTIAKDSTGSIGFPLVQDMPRYANQNINVTKSKLVESVIKVPVSLRFRLGAPRHNSAFEIGGYAGYRLGSHTKIKYNGGTKDKVRGNFNLNNFQYGVRATVRVHGIGIFGEYGLQPVFGKAPSTADMRTIALGINLL